MPVVQDLLNSLQQIEQLHRKKNDDYANSDNPFSNFDVSEYGLRLFTNPRDQTFVWPIFTKLARLSNLLNSRSTPNNESIDDSFIDIATYVLLWKADLANRKAGIHITCPNCNTVNRFYKAVPEDKLIVCYHCYEKLRD